MSYWVNSTGPPQRLKNEALGFQAVDIFMGNDREGNKCGHRTTMCGDIKIWATFAVVLDWDGLSSGLSTFSCVACGPGSRVLLFIC